MLFSKHWTSTSRHSALHRLGSDGKADKPATRLPELSLAYNGGKDCLVLLILYLCALHQKGLTPPDPNANPETAIKCVYIQAPHPFQEVEDFVEVSVKTYSLQLLEYAKPMKAAFADYLHDTPSVKAIFVGTRRTDPHGEHLKHFDPTDSGWPAFMRIHPVIDWHYVDIWTVSCTCIQGPQGELGSAGSCTTTTSLYTRRHHLTRGI